MVLSHCSSFSLASLCNGLVALGLPLGLSSVVLLACWWAVSVCPLKPVLSWLQFWLPTQEEKLHSPHSAPDPRLAAANRTSPLSSPITWPWVVHRAKTMRIQMFLLAHAWLVDKAAPPQDSSPLLVLIGFFPVVFISVCTWLWHIQLLITK